MCPHGACSPEELEIPEIRTTFEQLKQQQVTVLLVEQNVDLVTTLASRVAFMDRGRIVETCGIDGLDAPDGPLRRHLSL